mgnify:CR=1 FL=1
MKLKGLTAVVTGATSGIGREIALLFALEGAQVAVVGRNEKRGEDVVQDIEHKGGRASFFKSDLTVESSVEKMVAGVVEEYKQIDILVNNAGVVIPGSITDIGFEEWERTWQANVTSVYLTSRYVLPYMLERKQGTIVNMASEAGLKGFKDRAAYCSAKAAVVGMTKAMAVDHSENGIRVNCLCPGTIETDMVANIIQNSPDPEQTRQMMLDRRLTPFLGTTEEIAQATLFLASPEARFMTGAILSVDGGAAVK